MKVRLTRKLADFIDGVDLRSCQVGDVIDVSSPDGELLIAEGWASRSVMTSVSGAPGQGSSQEQRQIRESIDQERVRATAADSPAAGEVSGEPV